MDLQLNGKRALVTGSSSGIGEAIAKALAAEGVSVVVHGRRKAEADRVAAEITGAGGKAVVAIGDLGTDDGAAAVGKAALAAFGGIDILVNNAGAFTGKPWLETTAADWVSLYDQNVGSMVRMVNQLVPAMKETGWGRVISIASAVSALPMADMSYYSATKGANVSLAVSLSKALANTGITSNAVSPGPIKTPAAELLFRGMAEQMGWGDDWSEIEKKITATVIPNPTGRIGSPRDIADAVAFLASPRAGFINGANIRVDGGTVPTVN